MQEKLENIIFLCQTKIKELCNSGLKRYAMLSETKEFTEFHRKNWPLYTTTSRALYVVSN